MQAPGVRELESFTEFYVDAILDTNYDDSSNENVQLDPNGNPLGEEVTANGTAQPTVYYAVDDVNRANYDSTAVPSSRPVPASSQTYTYDKANFVTQGSSVAVQQYYGDGEIEQATSLPGGTPVSFSYDPEQDRIGESSATATTSYAFDAAGGMCWSAPTASIPAGGSTPSCSSPPTDATTYTYDGDGLRRTETTPSATQTFTWDTESSVPRLLEDGQSDYVYGPGGTPVAQVALSSRSVGFLVPDREGSVRDVVSGTTGLSLAYTDYDVYGNPTATGGLGLFTPFGFQGGYNDASGLVYFQQRYYDPGTGQFLSIDPLNDMTNSGYTFVDDNPLVGSDPSGQYFAGAGSRGCSAADNAESCRSTPVTGGSAGPAVAAQFQYQQQVEVRNTVAAELCSEGGLCPVTPENQGQMIAQTIQLYVESLNAIAASSGTTSSTDPLRGCNLECISGILLGVGGSSSGILNKLYNEAGSASHFNDAELAKSAYAAVRWSNTARVLAVAGAVALILNDVHERRSIGYIVGGVAGGFVGGSVGATAGALVCGGAGGVGGVVCGIAGGAAGGNAGSDIGSWLGNYVEGLISSSDHH